MYPSDSKLLLTHIMVNESDIINAEDFYKGISIKQGLSEARYFRRFPPGPNYKFTEIQKHFRSLLDRN